MKARNFLTKVRPDLATFQSDGVQARLTISICDDRGIPQMKDRFFVVTAKVDRQVQMGSSKQDRASAHPKMDAFNFRFNKDGGKVYRGQPSVRVLIQHSDIEDAYKIGCRAQQAPGHPVAPGKKPLCQTWDGVTATRWNGEKFIEMACLGADCPLRQEPPSKYDSHTDKTTRFPKPAKTQFKLIARLDEEDLAQLLVSECTGSDINVGNFASLVEGVTRQWDQLCEAARMSIPMSWFGVPIRMTVYPASGDGTRSPRIDYVLDCDIRELFTRRVEWQQRMSGWGSVLLGAVNAPLQLSASTLIDEDMDDLDAEEVLNPTQGDSSAGSVAQAVTVATPASTTPTQPETAAITAKVVTIEPTLYELVMKAPQLTTKVIKGFITDALTPAGTADADALEALMGRCIAVISQAPEKLPGMSAIWSPFADSIRELCPELDAKLVALGCPVRLPDPPAMEEDTPFGDVQESVKSPADLALEAFEAEFMRDDCPGARYIELYKKMTVAAGGVDQITKAHTDRCVELRKLKASK